MRWQQVTGKHEWHAIEFAGRINHFGKGGYYVYRNGDYLGVDEDLDAAKRRSEKKTKSATRLKDKLPNGMPAFLALTVEERKAEWEKSPPTTNSMRRSSMAADYVDMSLEALARAYNESVEAALARDIKQFKPIERFKDKATAMKFLKQIDAAVASTPMPMNVPKHTSKEELREQGQKAVKEFTTKKKAAKASPEQPAAAAPVAAAVDKGKVKEKAPGKAVGSVADFLAAISAREGTNKEKLASLLMNNFKKDLSLEDVNKAVYGKPNAPAIAAVISGLAATVKEKGLPYEIRRKEGIVGLHPTGK